jgi:hypothetical protein
LFHFDPQCIIPENVVYVFTNRRKELAMQAN